MLLFKGASAISHWQRYMLAGFAAIFLIVGAILSATDWLEIGSKEFVSGTLMKVGFVLALGWVAAPQLERLGWQKLRGSLLLCLIAVLMLLVIRPKIGAIAAALFVGGTILMALLGWLRSFTHPRR